MSSSSSTRGGCSREQAEDGIRRGDARHRRRRRARRRHRAPRRENHPPALPCARRPPAPAARPRARRGAHRLAPLAVGRRAPRGASGAATAALCVAGLDVLLALAAAPDLAALETLAELAAAADLARLAWRAPGDEAATPAAVRRPPRVVFSGVPVDLPFEAFLQASAEAEAVLPAEVVAGVGAGAPPAPPLAGARPFPPGRVA